jgi:hypothetical protein
MTGVFPLIRVPRIERAEPAEVGIMIPKKPSGYFLNFSERISEAMRAFV